MEHIVPNPAPQSGEDLSPIPCKMSKADVMAFAEEISALSRYDPQQTLEEVVEGLGGKLQHLGFGDVINGVDGSIVVDGPRNFIIRISDTASATRNRFTVAHEIGHYFLHSPNNDGNRLIAMRYATGRAEWEANWFAAAFLMPSNDFKDVFEKCGRRITEVAEHFQVSLEAATYQAEHLDLI